VTIFSRNSAAAAREAARRRAAEAAAKARLASQPGPQSRMTKRLDLFPEPLPRPGEPRRPPPQTGQLQPQPQLRAPLPPLLPGQQQPGLRPPPPPPSRNLLDDLNQRTSNDAIRNVSPPQGKGRSNRPGTTNLLDDLNSDLAGNVSGDNLRNVLPGPSSGGNSGRGGYTNIFDQLNPPKLTPPGGEAVLPGSDVDDQLQGVNPPPEEELDIRQATLDRLRDLLGSQQDPAAARAALDKRLQQAGEKQLVDARARGGAAGFGLSGAQINLEGDLSRKSNQDRELSLQQFDQSARNQALAELRGIQSTFFTDKGFDLSSAQIEEDVGLDLNQDGKIGNQDVADFERDEQNQENILSNQSAETLINTVNPSKNNIDGFDFLEISASTRRKLEELGITFKPVKVNKPLGWDMSGEPFNPTQGSDGRYYLVRKNGK